MSNTTQRLPAHLVEAVTAAPDDDAPRLAAAAWLAARGDPWAELIGVQCAIAAAPAPGDDLLRREHAWLDAHRNELAAALGVDSSIAVFRRGFVECVGLTARAEIEPVVGGLRGHPVRRVWIHGPGVDQDGDGAPAAVLAEWLSSTCLEALALHVDFTNGNHVSCAPDFFERLAASPRVCGVRSLGIGGELMTGNELALLASPGAFPNLQTLEIASCARDPDHHVRALVASPRDGLRRLDLSAYCVDSSHDTGGVPASLFEASRLRLNRLDVGLGDETDVAAWEASPVTASLSELHLHVSGTDPTHVASLLRSPRLAHLRRITLFSWDGGWERFVGELGRSALHFEQPRTDWDWVTL